MNRPVKAMPERVAAKQNRQQATSARILRETFEGDPKKIRGRRYHVSRGTWAVFRYIRNRCRAGKRRACWSKNETIGRTREVDAEKSEVSKMIRYLDEIGWIRISFVHVPWSNEPVRYITITSLGHANWKHYEDFIKTDDELHEIEIESDPWPEPTPPGDSPGQAPGASSKGPGPGEKSPGLTAQPPGASPGHREQTKSNHKKNNVQRAAGQAIADSDQEQKQMAALVMQFGVEALKTAESLLKESGEPVTAATLTELLTPPVDPDRPLFNALLETLRGRMAPGSFDSLQSGFVAEIDGVIHAVNVPKHARVLATNQALRHSIPVVVCTADDCPHCGGVNGQ